MSPDVWPELNDAPGGLTDSRGGMHETSQPAFKKDALLDSKLSSLPSSSHNLGQKEVSKVSETVQEELTPPPQKAALKGESKSDDPKKKKNIGESSKSKNVPSVSISILTSHCPDHILPSVFTFMFILNFMFSAIYLQYFCNLLWVGFYT